MARLSISLLGPIQVTLDGEPITRFRVQAAQALLAYVSSHASTALRRETLAGLLWPDRPESEALVNLRQALRRLRTAIADEDATPPFLIATRTTLAFNSESDYWLDVAAFDEALAEVRTHDHSHLERCTSCAQRLREVVDLYRGDFLQGFSLDSALFEEWMVVERERLHRQVVESLGHLAAYHESRSEYAQAIEDARRQVSLEPWRESAHRQCMRALAASGQRGASLAQYEACRRILADELGIEPEPETVALHERIRVGAVRAAAPDKGAEPSPVLPTAADAPRHNLPAQLTPFVGREALLAEIAARLETPACRLLTLLGPGGSGKTRLALKAAAGQLDHYSGGVYLVSLAPLQSAEAIVPTIAQAIGYALHAGDAQEQLLDYLRRKEMLLILDNVEHLLSGVGVAADVLRAAPGVRILATSRAALNLHGEYLLAVSGMEYPSPSSIDFRQVSEQMAPDSIPARIHDAQAALREATTYSAVELFESTAQRLEPDFELRADTLPHVVRICHLLSGMPLGIVLAASWIVMLSPAEIERELASPGSTGGLNFLEADLHDVPARQRSMRAVFDYSWSLLSAREQAVMNALSVFRGGFARNAAQAIAGASLRDLMALVRRSLLHRTPTGRFELHELLRQYAAEGLDQAAATAQGEQHDASARDRHCAYYTAALTEWENDLRGARQKAVLDEIDAEIDNLRAAWSWAVEKGDVANLERAAEGLGLYYGLRALDPEGEAAFRAAGDRILERYGQERAGQKLPADGLRALARMRMWQGVCGWNWLHTDDAHRVLLQSLEILQRPELAAYDTRRERGILLFTLGGLGFDTGLEDTEQRLKESLVLFQTLDSRWWVGRALLFLGILALDSGKYGSAKRYFEESLAASEATGNLSQIATVLGLTGATYAWLGELEQGERLNRKSLAIMEALGNRSGIASALEGVDCSVHWAGRFDESDALMERSLAIWNELGTRRTTVMQNLARAKMHLGQYERAHTLGQAECAHHQEQGLRREVGPYLDLLGTVALGEGAHAQAYRWLQEGISVYREFEMLGWLGNAVAVMGYAARGTGRTGEARTYLTEALRLAQQLESWQPVVLALPAISLLLADQGQVERAVELYALASTFGYVSNSRWYHDVAGREIDDLAAALSPKEAAAAQEQGRGRRILWATVDELLAELDQNEESEHAENQGPRSDLYYELHGRPDAEPLVL